MMREGGDGAADDDGGDVANALDYEEIQGPLN